MTYREHLKDHPDCKAHNVFFAFSNDQIEKGLAELGLETKDIVSVGSGLYGTRKGIKSFLDYYDEREQRIKQDCTPQEVYDFEFVNYECDYTRDDSEALENVHDIFGTNVVVKRGF
jgi:hypothetical protein